jgi:hypothetical protein
MLNVIRSIRSNYFAFFAVGYLIAITANTFFYTTVFMIVVGFLLFGFVFVKKGHKIDHNFHVLIIIITVILLGQAFISSYINPITILGVYLRFFTAYFIIKLVNKDFFVQYINFVYITAILGLVFYALFTIFPALVYLCENYITPYVQPPFQEGIRKHIIVYDYSNLIYKRYLNFGLNAGFYWEPGAQAIFIMFAFMFHTFSTRKILNKVNIWLFIALLTTFSTTGYVSFMAFILMYNIAVTKYRVLQIIFTLILSFIFYKSIYSNVPFLKDKIEADIEYINSSKNEGSRFESFLLDFNTAMEHPLFGKDNFVDEQGEIIERNKENHRNNGIGILLGTYGFFAFFLYMRGNYLTAKKLQKSWGLPRTLIIIFMIMYVFLNFGMPLTLRPFLYGMMMLFMLNTTFKKSYN